MVKKIIIVFILAFIVLSAYKLGKSKSVIKSDSTKQEESLICPYIMKAENYKEYLKYGWPIEIKDKPKFIDNPEIVKLSKPFIQKEFEKELYKLPSDKGWSFEEFDVDGDSKKEKIISASVAMNHTPHLALIVKNGNIIFEAEGANNVITEELGGSGFLQNKTIDWNTGETMETKYAYKDGGFIPVWTQKGCLIQFE